MGWVCGGGGGGRGVLKHGVGDEAVHGGSTARLPALAPDPEKKGANGKGKAGREWQGWRQGGPVAAPAFEGTFVSRREEGRGNVMQARANFRNRCQLYYYP